MSNPLFRILAEARACQVCAASLPLGPKPLVVAHPDAQILILGQAPGKATHEAGVPWRDRSGDRLRSWLGLSPEQFYDPKLVAFVPSGFCYPGSGKTGDLPPRPECAPLWHPQILPRLKKVELRIILGTYAFGDHMEGEYANLSDAAADYRSLLPGRIVLPHPSPRNGMWAAQRPWFESDLLPAFRARVQKLLAGIN